MPHFTQLCSREGHPPSSHPLHPATTSERLPSPGMFGSSLLLSSQPEKGLPVPPVQRSRFLSMAHRVQHNVVLPTSLPKLAFARIFYLTQDVDCTWNMAGSRTPSSLHFMHTNLFFNSWPQSLLSPGHGTLFLPSGPLLCCLLPAATPCPCWRPASKLSIRSCIRCHVPQEAVSDAVFPPALQPEALPIQTSPPLHSFHGRQKPLPVSSCSLSLLPFMVFLG